MRRPARIQDVAAAAGVSVTTVSNVLNRPERVNARTVERVRSVIADLDYVPHPGAVGLRAVHARSIGLVLPDIANSFYARIAKGAADAAYRQGYALSLCHSDDDPAREQEYLSMLVEQRASGAVVVPLSADPGRLERLRRRGVPLVLADRTRATEEGCSVSVDDVAGGTLAVRHLLEGGARSVLVVNGTRGIRQCADRYQGARQAARRLRGVTLEQIVAERMTVECGTEAVRRLETLPDAVFCTNDFLAVGVCRGLAERGADVPGDVRVVGYGDLDVAGLAALTTIRQPVEELGSAAIELLLDEVEAGADHAHEARVFAPSLVVRETA
ncbi:LacI family transcriptional regulator [Streptosporangium becharense]|uniref:LacI family transcriptional regulator n=1 Tax=Streptosporangium becharense TaxID=1816182 RepID=A0A7W9IMH9_9ACTN|nr:LacI family DNA-binding transcriptional regulator [Streptosporangium becharense]MBB2910578.1 LacI family transcriptional regulator [Streptosporangium becharense]MBB5823321.1 LacI family transcriptional regulator [Streptosporangium becharense]